jgi:hypothetical protein
MNKFISGELADKPYEVNFQDIKKDNDGETPQKVLKPRNGIVTG